MGSVSWLWWAPLGAAALHIGEEFVYPGGFATWDRKYRPGVRTSITPMLHFYANALLLLACVAVGASGAPDGVVVVGGIRFRSVIPGSLSAAAWLTLAAVLFSNTVFHLIGTFQTRRVSPGVRTGVVLYVPLALVGYWYFLHTGHVSFVAAALSALVGRIISGPRWCIGGVRGSRQRRHPTRELAAPCGARRTRRGVRARLT